MKSEARKSNAVPPTVFHFNDYREFLRAFFEWRRKAEPAFSLRRLAAEIGVSVAYLPSVLNGKRKLSADVLDSLAPALGLGKAEGDFLALLRKVAEAPSLDVRLSAYQAMIRQPLYREKFPAASEVFHYLDHWYYVAVRELVNTRGFREDGQWIARRLGGRITAAQAEQTLDFLVNAGFLRREKNGRLEVGEKELRCEGGIFRIAIASFHEQMSAVTRQVLKDNENDDQRHQTAYTLAVAPKQFARIREILENAVEEIAKLEKDPNSKESVYHISLAAVPLTSERQTENE